MDGKQIAKIIDDILAERGMTQKEFCTQLGIQSSAMSMWRKGSTPKPERLKQIEKCLGISFADYEKCEEEVEETDELTELLEELRNRENMRMLFRLAKGATPDDVRQAVKIIEALRK